MVTTESMTQGSNTIVKKLTMYDKSKKFKFNEKNKGVKSYKLSL
jgi:hypothetical protein